MFKDGPIILIDDDQEDLDIFRQALEVLQVKNKILEFTDPHKFLHYLSLDRPKAFFILCDINMGFMDGFALRKKINETKSLSVKVIPFLYCSTSNSIANIEKAFELPIQGYFTKPTNFDEIIEMFWQIIGYWNISNHPASGSAHALQPA